MDMYAVHVHVHICVHFESLVSATRVILTNYVGFIQLRLHMCKYMHAQEIVI